MTTHLEHQVAELRRDVQQLQQSVNSLRSLVIRHVCRTNPRLNSLEETVYAMEEPTPPDDLSGTLAALVTNVAELRRRLSAEAAC